MKEKINRDNVENNYPDEEANQLDVEFRGLEREKLFCFSMNEKYIIYYLMIILHILGITSM